MFSRQKIKKKGDVLATKGTEENKRFHKGFD